MATNNDIKYISFTFENEEQSNISPNDVEVEITALDKYKIAEYKFNNTLYDLIPEFNAEFTDYTYEDVVDGEVTTRTIYNNSLPTKIRFGIGNADSTGFDGREKALLEVLYLDNSNLITEEQMFQMCNNLTKVDGFVNNTMHIMNHMFAGCYDLTTVNASNWDTSNVQYMQYMFYDCPNLTSLDVSKWNTSNVTNMENMFCDCREITSLDIANWNTDKVTSMENMFYGCHKLSSLDVSNWNTNSVTGSGFKKIFADCYSLQSLDLTNWNTSNITDFIWLFTRCHNLTTLGDISNWNTSNVDCFDSMFFECRSLTELDLSGWDTSNVTDMGWMFHLCTSLNKLNISNWDTNSVTYIEGIFSESVVNEITMNNSDYSSVNKIISELPTRTSDSMGTLNIEGIDDISQVDITTAESKFWNVESGIEQIKVVEYKFTNSSDLVPVFNEGFVYNYEDVEDGGVTTRTIYSDSLPTRIKFGSSTEGDEQKSLLEVNYLDTSNITDMKRMFSNCNLLTLIVTSNFDTSNVTDMKEMFYNCQSLTSLDVSNFDTSNVTDMNGMFYNCQSLTSLDVSNFDTHNVSDMSEMFYKCYALTSLDVSNFDTHNVTKMSNMFYSSRIPILNLSNWNVDNVTSLGAMFAYSKITQLNLSNWNVDNVTNMNSLFYGASELVSLNINNWNIDKASIDDLFYNCNKLNYINMKNSDYNSVNKIISILPTRTSDSIGTLNIPGIDRIDEVDITTAHSKCWNIDITLQGKVVNITVGYNSIVRKLLNNKKIKSIYLGDNRML